MLNYLLSILRYFLSLFHTKHECEVNKSLPSQSVNITVNFNTHEKKRRRKNKKIDNVGDVKIFAGKLPPDGWLFCDGSLLQIRDYPVLHKVIGNVFGGDGIITFRLPDLRGRVPVGAGQGEGLTRREIGQFFGSETVVVDIRHLPLTSSSNVRPIGKMPNQSVTSAEPEPLHNIQPSLALNYIIFSGHKRDE